MPALPTSITTIRATGVLQAVMAAANFYPAVASLYQEWQRGRAYVVTVRNDDDLYFEVHHWLLKQMTSDQQRSVVAVTSRGRNQYAPVVDSAPVQLRYRYDGTLSVMVRIEGHPIRVELTKEDSSNADQWRPRIEHIVFWGKSQAARDAIQRVLASIVERMARPENPRVFVAQQYGGWAEAHTIQPRDPSSVVLATGQWERLTSDLGQFLGSEKRYASIGAPWHRGYLLHGPPGTGKTSTALALAHQYGMDVYYLPLTDLKSDTDLFAMILNIPDRSVLLLEDIDVVHAATSRNDDKALSTGGLLNSLDGALTPHGLVTVMTTNRYEALDTTLIRPGRCDLVELLDYLTDEQLTRLMTMLTGHTGPLPALGKRQVTASEITEIIKAHITDLPAARAAVVARLREELREDV